MYAQCNRCQHGDDSCVPSLAVVYHFASRGLAKMSSHEGKEATIPRANTAKTGPTSRIGCCAVGIRHRSHLQTTNQSAASSSSKSQFGDARNSRLQREPARSAQQVRALARDSFWRGDVFSSYRVNDKTVSSVDAGVVRLFQAGDQTARNENAEPQTKHALN